MSKKTSSQFDEIAQQCKGVFDLKSEDYGPAWRILRPASLTDQIYIKAQRIRSIDEKKEQRIAEGIEPEFIGIINYSIMALIQLDKGASDRIDISNDEASELYTHYLQKSKALMLSKNHDYGEAWRNMKVSSITDIILMKILRIKQIENNEGQTKISEGLDANYLDILNYGVFALILLSEQREES